ncbi:PREDICTED: uncharacterized protein DDB_G0271670-like [Rhagoletis zephyria]|uniref:uncharacterized protein DDB_G0271670-like n=1 Tax=Rhagoletis zephyria TaxID=28612 RepID=UPI00081167BA|nr:PREDICTED: uncharacterized protein DDB_G0271670-like [Rhagoletis zephyria]
MEKLTKFYKLMYGSMDTLFVSRREDQSHRHRDSLHKSSPSENSNSSSSSNGSPVSGYSSMSNLSQITSNNTKDHSVDQSATLPRGLPPPAYMQASSSPPPSRPSTATISTPPAPAITLNESPSQNLFFAKKPKKKQSWPDESSSTTTTTTSTSHGGDSDSCYSDASSYSLSFRTVNVFSEGMYHSPRTHLTAAAVSAGSTSMAQHHPPTRPSPLTLSRRLSQSSQSLPSIAIANASKTSSSTHKGSFTDLLARKKNKQKSKANGKSTLEVDNKGRSTTTTTTTTATKLGQHSASTSHLPSSTTSQVNIGSVKDLVEVLIYQLQVLERCQSQLQVQNQNLERANKVYHQKLELAAKEADLARQKVAMLEGEVWRCFLCSRDKIQLYSADVAVVALTCGHLLCVHCASEQQQGARCCPKCSQPFTIERRVHL